VCVCVCMYVCMYVCILFVQTSAGCQEIIKQLMTCQVAGPATVNSLNRRRLTGY